MNDEKDFGKSDYLWDGSGTPDPEIVKLERAVGKFRHARPAPEWPALKEIGEAAAIVPRRPLRPLWFRFAGLAAIALLLFSVWALRLKKPIQETGGWGVTSLAGTPRGREEGIPGG